MKTLGGFDAARAFGGIFEREERSALRDAITSRDVERGELSGQGGGDVNVLAFEVALPRGVSWTRAGDSEQDNSRAKN